MQPKPTISNRFLCYILPVLLFMISSTLKAQPPIPEKAFTFGGAMGDVCNSAAADVDGNLIYTGMYSGTVDFDPGTGVANLTSSSGLDIYILKLNAVGNFVWARFFGGPNTNVAHNVETDDSRNVYISGWFSGSVDFDPGSGTAMRSSNGLADAFFLILDSAGNFMSVYTFGGAGDDWGTHMRADADGNVYMMGIFKETADFDPTAGAYPLTSGGGIDIFLVKIDPSGNFAWAGQISGPFNDNSTGLEIDASGNLYLSGEISANGDLDPGSGVHNISALTTNGFVEKLDVAGNLLWATTLSSDTYSVVKKMKLDGAGHLYCAGEFQGTTDLDPGAGTMNRVSNGSNDLYALKLDTSGNMMWAQTIGGASSELAEAFSVDVSGNCYIGGLFGLSVDFDPGPGTATLTANFSPSMYLVKLDAAGNYQFAVDIKGTFVRDPGDIEVQGDHIYLAGYFSDNINFGDEVYTAYPSQDPNPDAFIFTYLQSTSGPLPLTLLSFEARVIGDHPHLEWVTQQEDNVSHFVVERSSDGRQFTAIAQLQAGGSFSTHEYEYTDQAIQSGTWYYRLKSVDRDGRFTHSPVRKVTMTTNSITVKVYPVPANGQLTINTMAVPASAGQLIVEWYNSAGVLVTKTSVQPAAVQTVNIAGLAAGSYTLRILGRNIDQLRQVIIQ